MRNKDPRKPLTRRAGFSYHERLGASIEAASDRLGTGSERLLRLSP